ncbi:Molybdopterin-guanine dinucleotide biosynthesis protein MobA [Thermogutta terrifontis]|uniref:Probable molybdenum cofactor guanylyltransferase n=1 Tax=Thermogutta terrifontis TaxID=1331910 RepID=A0A286RAB4_9BACT|nr:molybdenum cofactor guanylyltransferase [Thermogutta terrifontis]ASV72877.1 Molybdopterin-guanine dinucleotide biosynthesis protein MobA [Thermogutta terrifontis]
MVDRIPVYILAGGKSRRFGSDKALATLAGEPLLVRLARMVTPFATSVTVVADRPGKYSSLGLRTIGDLSPGQGPLGGLITALDDLREPWMLLLSCDLVLVKASWIDRLMSARRANSLAVAFHHDVWEPLCALYSRDIRPRVQEAITAGRWSLQELLAAVPAVSVALPPDWPPIVQINTPDDFRRAEEWLKMARQPEA